MLTVDNKKMSKSKNNFFLVRDIAKVYGYEPVRFMELQVHYRSQLNFTEEVIQSCKAALERLYNCKSLLEQTAKTARDGDEIPDFPQKYKEQFITVMDDDLNTADGISAVFELVRESNTYANSDEATKKGAKAALAMLEELCGVLGLLYNKEEEIPDEVKALVSARQEARKAKNFTLADEIRDKITALGFEIRETRQGTDIKKL